MEIECVTSSQGKGRREMRWELKDGPCGKRGERPHHPVCRLPGPSGGENDAHPRWGGGSLRGRSLWKGEGFAENLEALLRGGAGGGCTRRRG